MLDVLVAALARSGAQDAAHTARHNARDRAFEAARRAAEEAARKAAEPVVPAEHVARAEKLTGLQAERDRLAGERDGHDRAASDARKERFETSRLRPWRRDQLGEAIAHHSQAWQLLVPHVAGLEREISSLSRQVDLDDRAREPDRRAKAARPARLPTDEPHLERPRPGRLDLPAARTAAAPGTRRALEEQRAAEIRRRPAHDHSYGRGRDDSRGIGW